MRAHDNGSFTRDDDPGEPTTGNPRVSITTQEGRLLHRLTAGLRVVELGTGLGVSTGWMLRDAHTVVTIDVDPWVYDTVWPELHRAHPVGLLTMKDRHSVSELFARPDVVFIDADHAAPAVEADVAWALETVCDGGLVICHDAAYPGVQAGLGDLDEWLLVQSVHGLALRWR